MTDAPVDRDYLLDQAGSSVDLLDEAGDPAFSLVLGTPGEVVTRDAWESWSVDLTGPADPLLPQATMRLRFADGREDWLFLVPVGADADSTTYECTFSREAR